MTLENLAQLDRIDLTEVRPTSGSFMELSYDGLRFPRDLWTEITMGMDPLAIIVLSQASTVASCADER